MGLFLEGVDRQLDEVRPREESRQAPELFTAALGEVEVDFLQVIGAVMARHTLGPDPEKLRGDTVREDVPGVLDRIAFLHAADKEVQRPLFE